MATAKKAKKTKGKAVGAKRKGARAKAEAKAKAKAKAPKAPKARSLARKAKKAIAKSVKGAARVAKQAALGAKRGVAKQAKVIAKQATAAKKTVTRKARRIVKEASAARDTVEKKVRKQARSVAKQATAAKAVVLEKAAGARKAKASVPAPTPTSDDKVAVGASAPSFSLPDQNGKLVSSESLKGTPYVLYFYPKDDTTGCTKEACGFRDSGPAFGKNGVRIVGVSPDSEQSHSRFAEKYGLPFTLLSDADKTLANAYGVWVEKQNYGRTYMGVQRSTFLVDAQGRVQKVWRGVSVQGHVEEVLAASS